MFLGSGAPGICGGQEGPGCRSGGWKGCGGPAEQTESCGCSVQAGSAGMLRMGPNRGFSSGGEREAQARACAMALDKTGSPPCKVEEGQGGSLSVSIRRALGSPCLRSGGQKEISAAN